MMMDQARRAALQEIQTQRNELLAGKNKIPLDDTEELIWDIQAQQQALLLSSPDSDTTELFQKVVTHVGNHKDLMDYVGIDFHQTMFENMDESKKVRLAFDIEEAHALSISLTEELKQRIIANRWEQEILVLIKDEHSLFTIKDINHAHLYMALLTNLETLAEVGALFGIHLLMEVTTDTPENESRKGFKQILVSS